MICPKCQFDCPADFCFCPKCGTLLQRACPKCGFQVPAEFAFCPKCGSAVAAPVVAAERDTQAMLAHAIQRLIPAELAERLRATRGQVSTERRLVTILFCDVKDSTARAAGMDPEDVLDMVNGAFEVLIPPIYQHEGTLAQLLGDAILAFFGAPIAHEDDPERACRAALDITAKAAKYAKEIKEKKGIEGFGVRVGIHTGLAVVGEVGVDLRVGYTAVGDTINLAARMEQNAPVGGVLISHDTYRHVRGVFDVQAQSPLMVKGHAQPVQTYLVQGAKPRAFRLETRGVEGVETRTVGRESELQALQNACLDAFEGSETRAVIVTGDAGVGKSRLLYEFLSWAELRPERFWLFKGRARAETQAAPCSVLRDLFSNRFEILESDSPATALTKFRAGMAGFLEADRADVVGHLSGFDFSSSRAVHNLLDSSDFARVATACLVQYIRVLTAQRPAVLVLEDLHWADDSTLDLLDQVVTAIPAARLLLVCLARPALFERRPHWGEGREAYVRLDLRLLSRRQSRVLVGEILQKMPAVPEDLYGLILDSAEGNPFYIEELVKMLIEEGVIVRGQEQWSVELPRLAALHVPPTLTGVLQARLDSLPHDVRDLLQRAAVVGRIFWDGAVAALATGEPSVSAAGVGPLLDTVRERELVFRREQSSFAGSQEYIFKHLILHDVTYETVLLRVRREYHRQVAQWLEANAGERVAEYAGLIAGHYERAGEAGLAVTWLTRAIEAAGRSRAWREVVAAGRRALALVPEKDKATRAAILGRISEAHGYLGQYGACREELNGAVQLAREAGERVTAAKALSWLAFLGYAEGDFAQMRTLAGEALALARAAGDATEEARALQQLGIAALACERDPGLARSYYEPALVLARQLENRGLVAALLNNLGEVSRWAGDLASAARYYEECLAVHAETGARWATVTALGNLGEVAAAQNDPARAQGYFQEALTVSREFEEWPAGDPHALGGLGHLAAGAGDVALARSLFMDVLSESWAIGASVFVLYALIGFARLKALAGDPVGAAEWLGLAMNHPSAETDVLGRARTLLSDLRAALPAAELEAALARGARLSLDAVVKEILSSPADRRRAQYPAYCAGCSSERDDTDSTDGKEVKRKT